MANNSLRGFMRGWTLAFDLDGTLIDTAPDLIGATNHVISALDLEPIPESVLRPRISYGSRHLIATGLKLRGVAKSEAELDGLLEKMLAHYAENIAVASRPFDDMVSTLEAFHREGARLVVCTNKREHLSRRLLGALGLDRLFLTVAGVDTFPVCKPDPGHLTGVIAHVGGDPRRAVMVGDSDVDIETAKAAGIPVVGVTFGYSVQPVGTLGADAVIDHYRELDGVIRGIVGSRAT
jgi:phosphoglycolate phosphatase